MKRSLQNKRPVELKRNSTEQIAATGSIGTIRGYGVVFYNPNDPGTEYRLGKNIFERVSSKAFPTDKLTGDIRSKYNHNQILGRTTAGTLRVGADNVGVWYETDLPDNSVGNDLAISVERGDVDGSSFHWEMDFDKGYSRTTDDDGRHIWDLVEINRFIELGPVDDPAYEATTAGMRSAALAEAERYISAQAQADADFVTISIQSLYI